MDKGVVYQIPCAQCNKVYIGETGRPLKTKISEHNRAVATGDVWNANATHWMKTNHDMDWDIVDGQTSRRRGRSRRVCTSGPGECTTYSGSTPSPVWNSLISDWPPVYDIVYHSLFSHLIGRMLCVAHACYPDQSLPIGLVYNKLPLFSFFCCIPDEACDGQNVALKWQLEVTSHLLACLIVQNNHSTTDRVISLWEFNNKSSRINGDWNILWWQEWVGYTQKTIVIDLLFIPFSAWCWLEHHRNHLCGCSFVGHYPRAWHRCCHAHCYADSHVTCRPHSSSHYIM